MGQSCCTLPEDEFECAVFVDRAGNEIRIPCEDHSFLSHVTVYLMCMTDSRGKMIHGVCFYQEYLLNRAHFMVARGPNDANLMLHEVMRKWSKERFERCGRQCVWTCENNRWSSKEYKDENWKPAVAPPPQPPPPPVTPSDQVDVPPQYEESSPLQRTPTFSLSDG